MINENHVKKRSVIHQKIYSVNPASQLLHYKEKNTMYLKDRNLWDKSAVTYYMKTSMETSRENVENN
jgi:hypothetical protein